MTAQHPGAIAPPAMPPEIEDDPAPAPGPDGAPPTGIADAILEAISDGFFALDRAWRFRVFNRSAERAFGLVRAEVLGRRIWDVSPGIVGGEFERRYRAVMETGAPEEFEIRSSLRREQIHEIRAFPLPDGIGIVFRDVTERRRAEEHRATLVSELDHRAKNIFAVVGAIVDRTLREADDIEAARRAISERLVALSRAHEILTRDTWDGAEMGELVGRALEPYRARDESRFVVGGDPARVEARTALALAMALQELSTNATKYGALSNATGCVSLTWRVEPGDPPRLRLTWRESGGPAVTPPSRRGFGTRLIERSLGRDLGGEARIAFEPAGVVCTIDAGLSPLKSA